MKKILYFQHVSSLGGSGLCLLKLIQGLDKAQYQPLVVLREKGPLVPLLEEVGATIYFDRHQYMFGYCSGFHPEWWELGLYRSLLRIPLSAWTGYRWVKKLHPDIVHVNSMALIASGIGAKLAGCKVVLHIREQALRGRFGIRRKALSFLMTYFFDRRIAICEANRFASGVDPAQCDLVYDWVVWDKDVMFESSELRRELAIPDNAQVILFLGGESSIKGTDIFLAALGKLKINESVIAVCAGPCLVPSKKSQHLYRARLDDLAGKITIPLLNVGVVENVGEYMALCDFLVVPSAVPHFSNPVIEAAWLGKPSIMSNDLVGQEMIQNGHNGLLFNAGDSVDLCEIITRLITNPLEARDLGCRAKERFQKDFSSENIGQIESIYSQLTKNEGATA